MRQEFEDEKVKFDVQSINKPSCSEKEVDSGIVGPSKTAHRRVEFDGTRHVNARRPTVVFKATALIGQEE